MEIEIGLNLAPPTVEMNMLDFSSADSIDLNSNASIVDVLKTTEKDLLTNDLSDSDVYFDFMPKRPKH